MTDNEKRYHRILLKLSGEVLQNKNKHGINLIMLDQIVKEIKLIVNAGIEIAIIIGGGNLFRGKDLFQIGINRVVSDQIGMLSTVINGLAIRDVLFRNCINAKLMSIIPLEGICYSYNWIQAISFLKKNKVVILSAGIGVPFFTTDVAACLRGIEIKANIIIKATKVNGIYSEDPLKNPNAKFHDQLTYQEVLDQKLKIMDSAAFILAKDYSIPIRVFNIKKPGALFRVAMGKKEGTLVSNN